MSCHIPENSCSTKCLRLFLSVDLVGSTALKERYNHVTLVTKFNERVSALQSIFKNEPSLKKFTDDPFDPYDKKIVSYILPDISKEDSDWSKIIRQFFDDFDSTFMSEYNKLNPASQIINEISVWKCMGDELIYSTKVDSYEEVYNKILVFLKTLRSYDERACNCGSVSKKQLRLKGTAWTAGFPIRNREIEIRGTGADYLGPDMDIGFRIAQHTYPGFLCVSMDLAYLLGQHSTPHQLTAFIVGWATLKGVWNNKPYPIIWIAPPHYELGSPYADMRPWAPYENSYANEWQRKIQHPDRNKLEQELQDTIRRTWELSSDDLGLIEPYFALRNDDPNIPLLHSNIDRLLYAMSDGAAGSQGILDSPQPDDKDVNSRADDIISRIS